MRYHRIELRDMKQVNKHNSEIIEKYVIHRTSLGDAKTTVSTNLYHMRKLAKHLREKNFEEMTEDDLKSLFLKEKHFIHRDHLASNIMRFEKWLLKLKDNERPENMKWYRYSTVSQREKQRDPNVKAQLLETEEYAKIIQHVKMDLRISALYEALWLSGARPNEICTMKIKDVINEKGKISIIVTDSKTIPREIPLLEKPSLLLRWCENHPNKDNNKVWLFPSQGHNSKESHIKPRSLSEKFRHMVKALELKETLILYSFRKTRATIMFTQGYDDKEMGMLFGWKPHTVIERRGEYDLRGMDELKAKIFQKAELYKPREQLEAENKELATSQQDEITNLKKIIYKLVNKNVSFTKETKTGKPIEHDVFSEEEINFLITKSKEEY